MARVTWTEIAKQDHRAVVEWIAGDSVAIAALWAEKIRAAPDVLERFPMIGAPVEEFDIPGLRELLVGPYRILYHHENDVCRILHVIHGSRDLRGILDPKNLQ